MILTRTNSESSMYLCCICDCFISYIHSYIQSSSLNNAHSSIQIIIINRPTKERENECLLQFGFGCFFFSFHYIVWNLKLHFFTKIFSLFDVFVCVFFYIQFKWQNNTFYIVSFIQHMIVFLESLSYLLCNQTWWLHTIKKTSIIIFGNHHITFKQCRCVCVIMWT